MTKQWRITCCLTVVVGCLSALSVGAIDNQRGKSYRLTEKHGPWMIMVTSFQQIHDKDVEKKGMTAEEAANELVYELREKGIPAYTYEIDARSERFETLDRLGREKRRVMAAQRDGIGVIAGNYPSLEDPVAQDTLKKVKRYVPSFMKKLAADKGLTLPSGKGPLASAFLAVNPLRDPNDPTLKLGIDPDVKKLNSGVEFSLASLKKPYTLKVATFSGRTYIPGSGGNPNGEEKFLKGLINPDRAGLNRAGEDAEQLVRALRQSKLNDEPKEPFEAYVYHTKYESFVTVGGFDSKDDPRIRALAMKFMPKMKSAPGVEKGPEVMTPESLSLLDPNEVKRRKELLKTNPRILDDEPPIKPLTVWVFDPIPEIIEVPRSR